MGKEWIGTELDMVCLLVQYSSARMVSSKLYKNWTPLEHSLPIDGTNDFRDFLFRHNVFRTLFGIGIQFVSLANAPAPRSDALHGKSGRQHCSDCCLHDVFSFSLCGIAWLDSIATMDVVLHCCRFGLYAIASRLANAKRVHGEFSGGTVCRCVALSADARMCAVERDDIAEPHWGFDDG